MQSKIEMIKQRGFTLIELLVVMAVLGFLGTIMAVTFSLVTKVSMESAAHNIMLAHMHLAGNWITRDVESAKTVTLGTSPVVCTLTCYRWNGTTNDIDTIDVVYEIKTNPDGSKILTRKVNTDAAQMVAQYLSSATLTQPTVSIPVYQLNINAVYNNFPLNKIYKASQRYPQ